MIEFKDRIKIQENIAKQLHIEIGGLYEAINDSNDIHINGTVIVWNDEVSKRQKLVINADILDSEGCVMHSLQDYSTERLLSSFDSFSMYCASIKRFLDIKRIAAIRIYPVLYNR